MIFPVEFASQFAIGACAGLGQSFGQRFLPWVVQSWRWLTGAHGATSAPLIREVSLAEALKVGIPTGHRLFTKRGAEFTETTTAALAAGAGQDATLWLFQSGDVWQPTNFATNDSVGQAEVGVEFSPELGFNCILPTEGAYDRHWLAAFLQGTFAGILNSLSGGIRSGFVQGESDAIAGCSEKLDQSLRQHGIRCRGIRDVSVLSANSQKSTSPDQIPCDSGLDELASELSRVKTPRDWTEIVDSLKSAGVPVDQTTSEKLTSLQNQILDRQLPPDEGVKRLAELTADAFTRAGIDEPDLQRWQGLSQALGDLPADNQEDVTAPASASVAVAKRPGTWHIWSREEVDRRQLLFTRRTVKNCRIACEQGLLHLRELPALRDVRGLNEHLTLIEDLLATVPPLNPARIALRVDKQVAKNLVAAYADAVKTTEELASQIDALLKASPSSGVWNAKLQECRASSSKLTQMVRDRRTIR